MKIKTNSNIVMKTLYLIRHAKAERISEADHERPLSEAGKEEAKILGKFLKSIEIIPDIIISSTAKRALETSRIIAEKIELPNTKIVSDQVLYNITADELCKYIETLDDKLNSLMLVGHNPAMEEALSIILGKAQIHMTTASIAAINVDCLSWCEFRKYSYLSFFINSEFAKKLF